MRNWKRLATLLLCLALLAGCLSACAGKQTETQPSGETGTTPAADASGTPAQTTAAGKDTIIIASHQEFTILDPQNVNNTPDNRLLRLLYNNLVGMDYNTGAYTADVATEEFVSSGLAEDYYQISDTVWEFKIRKGVLFHNGQELKAEDVKFSLERAMNSAVVASKTAGIQEVNEIDDYTIQIVLKEPSMAFIANLFHTGCCIVPKAAVEAEGEDAFFKHPIGTGPYKFVSWTPGEEIVLERFEDYYDYYEGNDNKQIIFRVMPESTSRMIALETGEIDVVDYVASSDVNLVTSNPALELIQGTSLNVMYLGLNNSIAPFDDVRVRQAVACAVNRENIIATVLNGMGLAAKTVVGPGINYYYDGMDGFDYDVERAKQLLAEAGYPDGITMTLIVRDEDTLRIAQVLQADLALAGITVDIQQMEYATFIETCSAGQAQAYLGDHANGSDIDNSFRPLFYSDTAVASKNWHRYANETVDELISEGNRTADETKRAEIYKQLQEIIVEECPVIPLYSQIQSMAVQAGVTGVRVHPTGINHYMWAHWEK